MRLELPNPPQRVVWEITWRCNLRCHHCLVRGGKANNELSTDQALNLADSLAQLDVGAVTLTGGEPLMRKDWPQIASRLADHKISLVLSSNGHLLRGRNLRLVVELGFER